MQAMECGLAAPLAQQAWSPANALDPANIAAATKAVMVILIMVNALIAALSRAFKLLCDESSSIVGLVASSAHPATEAVALQHALSTIAIATAAPTLATHAQNTPTYSSD